MRILNLFVFMLFLTPYGFAQKVDSCMLVGIYALNYLEMSQEVNEKTPQSHVRWSNYENYGLSDTLIIEGDFRFRRSLNALGYFKQVLTGQFQVQQNPELTLLILKGQLYTMPNLLVEKINPYELVIIEKFRTRWIRRTFRSSKTS